MSANFRQHRESGMSMIGILMLVAAITAVSAGLSKLFMGQVANEQQVTLQQGAEMARANVLGAIAHDGAWKATIFHAENNSQLACMRTDGSTCTPPANSQFALVLADNTVIISPTRANLGFDRMGNPCDKFDAAAGNDDCPFRYEISWACKDGSCPPTLTIAPAIVPNDPILRINGTLVFRPKSKQDLKNALRTDLYNFSIVRGREEANLSSTCASIGGYFDQGKGRCSIQSSTACDEVREYMAGIDAKGNPICRQKQILGVTCPPRTAIMGMNDKGEALCGKF